MIAHRFAPYRDAANFFFFSTQFEHDNLFLQIAVSETVSFNGESTGRYTALVTTGEGTQCFEVYKDQEENWSSDNGVSQELVYVIGCAIDMERRNEATAFTHN